MADAGYEIGWWIESAADETYGPASRETIRRLLREEVISRNTLVRHCSQETARPVADQPGMLDGVELDAGALLTGDRLETWWPASAKESRKLAAGNLPCVRHRRPAVLVCCRCHAPYCDKCRAKPLRRAFYCCRRCQASNQNRRLVAFFLDGLLLYLLVIPASVVAAVPDSAMAMAAIQLIAWVGMLLLVFRDALLWGAGPGKRLVGLRVVQSRDGTTPLGYGQALIRYLPLIIPFMPIVEAVVLYRDPLTRRFGDRWAKTRVIDTPEKVRGVRARTAARRAGKEQDPVLEDGPTMEDLARFAE